MMSYTVKRQGEIKSFQFFLEGSCANFVTDVSRESVPRGRARKRERSLAEYDGFDSCSGQFHATDATASNV